MTALPAIVPAAGKSRRMGQPKLLMPFDGEPLIGRVVTALRGGGAMPVIVIAPPAAVPEGPAVAEAARNAGATVITPQTRPLEMRESTELAIGKLEEEGPPPAIALTPGDVPGITPEVVRQILKTWADHPEAVVIPRVAGRRAHPIVLPWDLACQIPSLSIELGINSLVAAHAGRVAELELPSPGLAEDMNTPDDFRKWNDRLRNTLRLRLFAVAREKAGQAEIDLELPMPSTVGDLRLELAMQYPQLAGLAPRVMVAVDAEYASDETMIGPGAKVAIIPPVSGGSEAIGSTKHEAGA